MTITTTAAPLMWAPPTMTNPTIIDLSKTGGQDYWQFSPDQDVIFVGGTATDTADKLQTQGGHNIMLLGGNFQPSGAATGTLAFYGVTGEVWIDGATIDNAHAQHGQDGIDIAGGGGAQPDLVVQNTQVLNVNGASSSGHADVLQTQGLAGNIDLYNVSGTTNYQGLFISPQYQPETKSATLENVNLSYTGPATNDGSHYSYLLWTLDSASEKPYPIAFDNVYVQPRAGQDAITDTVWPTAAGGAVQTGNAVSWPNLPYRGTVTVGTHADFADSTQIGVNFKDTQALLHAATAGAAVATVAAPAAPVAAAPPAPPEVQHLVDLAIQHGLLAASHWM